MPVPLDNPAGRLHVVLTRLAEHPDGQSLDQAWARALDCKENDFRAIGVHLAEVTSLLNDCRTAANSLSATADVTSLLWHFPSWSKAIFGFQSSRTTAVKARQIIGDDALASLGALATILHLHAPELSLRSDVDVGQLAECRQYLDRLIELVVDEPLIPGPVRSSILRVLGEVVESFDFLDYRGAERLARSASSAAQFITLEEASREFSTAPVLERMDTFAEKAKNIFEKIWSMLAPPTGAIYILATGDVMGGGLIMAANPQVAKSIQAIGSTIKAATDQRQIEPPQESQ